MTLKDLTSKDMVLLAKKAGTTVGYLVQLKYGKDKNGGPRCTSAKMAERLEKASHELFGPDGFIDRISFLYP